MPDLSALLWPKTVAVIGASPESERLRGRIMAVMTSHDYAGTVYPVSRSHDKIMGLRCYPSIDAVPEKVDLAIMIIPAEYVPSTLSACGEAGVRAVQILTSGFAEESGEDGSALQDEIRAIAERYDIAVVGPNSEGFANTAADLCPTFSPVMDKTDVPLLTPWRKDGHITAIAQSGGMGFAFYDHGRPKELPFNYIVTTGNEACIETLDVVDHLLDEGKMGAFVLFMEDVKRGERLAQVAEKALKAGTPIILTKIGRSDAGARAAASHTASLAGAYEAYQSIFKRYGVIEGDNVEEIVDIAAAFSYHGRKLPKGNRVGISTASGGGGGWMADLCVAAGLEVPELDAAARAEIDIHLPAYGTSQNPVDATAQAVRILGYSGLARMVAAADNVDGIISVASCRNPAIVNKEQDEFKALAAELDKPWLFCSYTKPHPEVATVLSQAGLPIYSNMRNCARALAEMANFQAVRERALKAPVINTTNTTTRQQATDHMAAAGPVLCEFEVKPLLALYDIDSPADALVDSADDAVAAAEQIGGPVVLKIQSPDVLHKTEAGGLALNLAGSDEVRAGYQQVMAAASGQTQGVLVQAMAPKGHEMILGINHDSTFGPMLGFGGIFVEVNPDVALSPVPLDREDARQLLDSLRGRALLDGVRGEPAADIEALLDLVVKLSRFATDHGDSIGELDLNPVLVHAEGQGVSIVDALLLKRT